MTALNDVLKAEQEADEVIETSKKEVEAMIASARTEQQTRLESEKNKLQEFGVIETKTQQVHVDEQVKKIIAETENQVISTEKRFLSKKDSIKSALMERFQ